MKIPHAAALSALVVSLVALTACTSTLEAPPPAPAPASSTPSAAAEPVDAAPSATAAPVPDPGDVSTWVVGSAGIGPIERGRSWAAAQQQLSGANAEQMCPSAIRLTVDGGPTIYVGLEQDGDTIRQVWASAGMADAAPVASPATAAGIVLGSPLGAVQASYPGIEPSVVPYPTAQTFYAVADAEGSWIVFTVSDDAVTQIGSSEFEFAPRELCG